MPKFYYLTIIFSLMSHKLSTPFSYAQAIILSSSKLKSTQIQPLLLVSSKSFALSYIVAAIMTLISPLAQANAKLLLPAHM